MTGFTEPIRAQASSAWHATGTWPDKFSSWQDERALPTSPVLVFGLSYVVISLIIVLVGEFLIVVYALLTSMLWILAAALELPLRAARRALTR